MGDRNRIGHGQEDSENTAPGVGLARPVRRSSHDDLFGKGILFSVALLFVLGTAFFILILYRVISNHDDSRESIASLTPVVMTQETVSDAPETAPIVPDPTGPLVDKASVSVKVFNGGAARGSAAKVVDVLRKAGFVKAEAGNATEDYAGVTTYYKADSEKAANIVHEALIPLYKDAKLSSQDAKQPETTGSMVTVILGK